MMSPPVGKSGAGRATDSSSSDALAPRLAARATTSAASQTSPRLCGGIDVAMPTAMPAAPLTRSTGTRAGSTSGSISDASKLSLKATEMPPASGSPRAALPRSSPLSSASCANFVSLHSV